MNTTTACVFPETLPDERLLFPLVQVFDQVVHLQAVEDEPLQQGEHSALIERCLRQGRLQGFIPVPLGDQRQRFMALVQDMRQRGVDYTSQLSMLTLAGLNRRDQRESSQALLSSLLQRSDIAQHKEADLVLWQSRLVLKLGEMYDREQAELDAALREITGREKALLAELREETETPFVLDAKLADTGRETQGILRHRLKAWSRLCFHGTGQPPGLLITRHQAAMDTLEEVFAKRRGQGLQRLASLELPLWDSPTSGTALAEPLSRACPSLQVALEILTAASIPPETEWRSLLSEGQEEWAQRLARPPRPDERECWSLDLFLFPEISARELLLESFCGGPVAAEPQTPASLCGCVVGLLQAG